MESNDRPETTVTGGKVSRRWMLRSTASLTAGVLAAGTVSFAEEHAEPAGSEPAAPPDHDRATGEIFDRERHHRWDTI